jgi:hypothetical protein
MVQGSQAVKKVKTLLNSCGDRGIAGHARYSGSGVVLGLYRDRFSRQPEYVHPERSQIPTWLWSSAYDVVAESPHALSRGQVVCISGFQYRLLVGYFSITSQLIF